MKKKSINQKLNSNQIAYGKNHFLELSRNTQYQPIVGFSTSITNKPCLDLYGAYPKKKSNTYYPLIKIKEKGCGEYGPAESLAHKMDFTGESQNKFLSDNGINYKTLPFFKSYLNKEDIEYAYYLQRIDYSSLKQCRNLDLNDINVLSKASEKFDNDVIGFGVSSLVLSLLVLIFIVLWIIRKKKPFFGKPIWLIIVYFFTVIIAIVVFCWGIKYFEIRREYGINKANKTYSHLLSNNCFKHEGFKKAAKVVLEYSGTSWNWIGKGITFLFVCSILFLIFAVILAILRRKTTNNNLCQPPL